MTAENPQDLNALSEAEEQALLERQRKRNLIFATVLGVLVLLIVLATMYMITTTGFVPMDNADLFRST
jgi:hypothetical protein